MANFHFMTDAKDFKRGIKKGKTDGYDIDVTIDAEHDHNSPNHEKKK